MKRMTVFTIILCIAFSVLAGCTSSPPENAADEMKRHHWVLNDETLGRTCTLDFDGDSIALSAQGFGEPLLLTGTCFVEDDEITVVSGSMGTVCMGCRLSGEKLTLDYCGKSITFIKNDNEN